MRTLLASAATLVMASLAIAPNVVAAQSNAPFCLKTAAGQLSCTYSTMGECEAARGSQSSNQCITRSDAGGTTGQGDTTPRSPASPNPLAVPEGRSDGRPEGR